MLALLFNLSFGELIAVGVVALLVFGKRLPEVAAQLAVQLQRARRSLQNLRRETGIDREMWEVRRRFEEAVPRDVESPTAAFRRARLEARRKLEDAGDQPAPTPTAPLPPSAAPPAAPPPERESEEPA